MINIKNMILIVLYCISTHAFANSIDLGTAYYVDTDYEDFNAHVSCSQHPFGTEAGGYYTCSVYYPDDETHNDKFYNACKSSSPVVAGDSYRGQNCSYTVKTYYDPVDKQHRPTSRVCVTTLWTQDVFTSTVPIDKGTVIEESCVMPPPPPGSIVCSTTDVTVDHGTLTAEEYNGNSATGTGQISCTGGDATVDLSLTPSTIDLSNGTQSKLTLANQQAEETAELKENDPYPFTVTSTLSAAGPVPGGEFHGSTVIIVTVE